MRSQNRDDKSRQAPLLAKIPPGTVRVYVRAETGQFHYKDLDQLADTDEIQVDRHGKPIVMMTKPGRKKQITLTPANDTVAEILRRKAEAEDRDPILRVAKTDPESTDVLHQIVLALGGEAASILFERTEAERRGEETSGLSVRRIKALEALAGTWLKRKEQLVSRGVDLDSPAFRAVFQYIVTTMQESMSSLGLRSELIETVFAKFSKVVDSEEWGTEARNRMKHVV